MLKKGSLEKQLSTPSPLRWYNPPEESAPFLTVGKLDRVNRQFQLLV
jgi:hypothetical protein